MNILLSGLIGLGIWLAMVISYVSQNEIAWIEHLPELLTGYLFGAPGLSLIFFVFFFREQRDVETQGGAIVREAAIRAVLLMVGILLIVAGSYLLSLAD